MSDPRATGVSRRTFLAMTAAGVIGVTGPEALFPRLSSTTRRACLRVARVGAVFPIRFPDFAEPGPPAVRATTAQLGAATARLSPARSRLVQKGGDHIAASGLLDTDDVGFLEGLGRFASEGGEATVHSVMSVAAVATAVLAGRFDPNSDTPADVWLGGMGILYERGELRRAAQRRLSA